MIGRARSGMIGQVPVGRRVLLADRRRGILTIAGVATALLLVLVLDAIFAGALNRVTHYIRTSPADVFVSQSGVRTLHMSASALPGDTADRAAELPGVAWAAPIAFTNSAVGGPAGRLLTYVIGFDPATRRGGPTDLVAGRFPRTGEAIVDELAAEQLGISVGSTATILGTPLRVSGLSSGGTSIANTITFVTAEEFARLRGPTVSYVLVGADPDVPADDVATSLATGLVDTTVQTRAGFAASEARIVSDMSADLLRLMSLIGLLIALAVIALGLLTSTMARLRDYAVLKALGADTRRLAGAIASQVTWTLVSALVGATALALLLAVVVPQVAPNIQLIVTPKSVATAGLLAFVAGLAAALLPLPRLARVDAATAFRENR